MIKLILLLVTLGLMGCGGEPIPSDYGKFARFNFKTVTHDDGTVYRCIVYAAIGRGGFWCERIDNEL